MAAPPQKPPPKGPDYRQGAFAVRIVSLVTVLVAISALIVFLVNYSGFHDWEKIDSNLMIFVAVNVNIVVLTAVFYMLLRNLFKLVYERKNPLAAVGLKTKLILAFLALSLPSAGFHLVASGFITSMVETWSQGEYQQALDRAQTVSNALLAREERLMRVTAENLLAYLPRKEADFRKPDWLHFYQPDFKGGVFIYAPPDRLVARKVFSEGVERYWNPPPPDYMARTEGVYWREQQQGQHLQRLLMPLPGSKGPLKVEVLKLDPGELSAALVTLALKRENARFLSNNLLALTLSVLGVLALTIIFAATWIAFYLARGFVTPVDTLAAATTRVSQGELGYQVETETLGPLRTDFEGLVLAFNLMSRQLKEQRLQLIETTEHLRNSHHELGERNRLVELLLENIDAGIVSVNPQGRITAINRAAKRLLQLRDEGTLERHYRVALQRPLVAVVEDLMEQARSRSQHQVSQNLTLTSMRKPVHVEVTVVALEKQGDKPEPASVEWVLMLKDVTVMQRNQRAQAWREVARRVAHEIKNPLTPIQLSAQRIRRKYLNGANGDTDVLDQCTQTIITEVASLKKMVNEFSQFAKLPESEPVPGDLNAVITELARFYENGLPENVRLVLDLDPAVPQMPLDAGQMKRAFTNLIDNAAASIEGEGTITLRTAYDPENQQVIAQVADDGAGVPDDVRSRMFEPYTSTKAGGTGLGLSIVNQIVSDHGGYIRHADARPRGTVFTMEFRAR